MRIAICDDEAVFRTYLRDILVKDSFARGTDIQVAEYADGEALLAALEAPDDYADVVFLDIRMPGMDGLETARALRQRGERCMIVFLTSLSEYARKGYEGVVQSLEWEGEDLLVGGVCIGTGVGNYEHYINRPTSVNDLHGVGAFLIMCTECEKTF